MTLQQMRYFVDVARTGSISQSAVNLYTSQPNLSSMMTQLEEKIGVQLLHRTNRGVSLTNDGVEFLAYAQKIVGEADHLEAMYQKKKNSAVSFRVAWTISNPVSEMICRYMNRIADGVPVSVKLLESNQVEVLEAVCKDQADGGKLTIPDVYLDLYESYCKSQGIVLHKLWKIRTCLLFSAESRLAEADVVEPDMITEDMMEVIYGPNGLYDLPNSSLMRIREEELPSRRIFFNDRGNLMDILALCPNTFIRAIPVSRETLKKHNLAMRHYSGPMSTVVEAAVYPDRPLGREARLLIKSLEQMKDPRHPYWMEGFGPEPV